MKKIFIALALLAASAVFANAQSKIYCELVGTQMLLSKKTTVQVDFGQETKLFSLNSLVDSEGKVIAFNSMVDAMNYMGERGWEFEQAYVVVSGSGSSTSSACHWILSKSVGEEGDDSNLKTFDMMKREQMAAQGAGEAEKQ